MKTPTWACALLAAVATTTAARAARDPAVIVRAGEPGAAIVLQPNASEQLAGAAAEMQRLVHQASGAALDIVEQVRPDLIAIHIGRTPTVIALDLDLGDLDGDGFIIRSVDERTLVILGPSDWGTEFGVYEFLERYVGVRWLMPGPEGTYVPEVETITVGREPVRDQPAFYSRKFFGLRLKPQQRWARRNRLHSRVEFHHQLHKLFPRSDVQEHPEFFPIRDGKRYLPPADTHFKCWQPCFNAPGIREEATRRIVTYFDENPEAESYSFGVTDSGGHCQCDTCTAQDPGRKNMVNRDHLSDRYFTWVNAVIEGVLKHHPDKWFGCLAYSEIFEPPDHVNVHPRMIPYMTYDRMQWIEPDARAAAEELTRRWAEASPVVGWYDYIYGAAYLVPRVYPHVMREYYKFAHDNGVRGLTAEAYPNFAEGPKLYISLKLQWNPALDVDALLDEWYELAVGAKAAPYVKKYYDHWEDFWTRRIRDSRWWRKGRQYLPFNVPTYLEDVTLAEIAQSRTSLEAAVAAAGTPPQQARANLLLQAFEYYEASVVAYPRQNLLAPALDSDTAAQDWMAHVALRIQSAAKRRQLAKETFHKDPFLHHCMDIDRYDAISGKDWGAGEVWSLFSWAARSEIFRNQLSDLVKNGQPESLRTHTVAMLTCLEPGRECLNTNPSFEEGDGARANDWSLWLQDDVGTLTRTEQAKQTGEYSMLGKGVQYGGPHQTVEFAPGRYCLTASLYVPEGQPDGGFVDLGLRALNEANRNLPNGGTTSITPTPGTWCAAATLMDVRTPPKGAVRIRAGVWARNFPPGKTIYIDDMRLFRLPD